MYSMSTFRVALLVEEGREIGRNLLKGISLYSKERGPWHFYRQPPFYYRESSAKALIKNLEKWGPDGIIMSKQSSTSEDILSLGVPTILSGFNYDRSEKVGHIFADDLEIGRMAAEHLVEKGFCHFGFCGFEDMTWSLLRRQGFEDGLERMGFSSSSHLISRRNIASWFSEPSLISKWLRGLPHPCAIFVCNDDLCWQVAEACVQVDIKVPEEIGLLGVDNDPLICEFASPPLSSIVLKIDKSGYDAAALLHRMMKGERVEQRLVRTPAPRVQTRHSTDIIALKDPALAKALNYIRNNYRKGVHVKDVAVAAGVSRRVLEKRFKDHMHRPIYEEVLIMRMNHAAFLLTETNMQIGQIAEALNYDEMKYFSRGFRKVMGMTPMEYRRKHSIGQVD